MLRCWPCQECAGAFLGVWGKSRLGSRLIASTWHLHPQPIGTRRPTFLGLELLLGLPKGPIHCLLPSWTYSKFSTAYHR